MNKIIGWSACCSKVGKCRLFITTLMRLRGFPRPSMVQITTQKYCVWDEDLIDAWLKENPIPKITGKGYKPDRKGIHCLGERSNHRWVEQEVGHQFRYTCKHCGLSSDRRLIKYA